jgi:hypothetical protein
MKPNWPRPDFLPTANRPPWLAWLWLATAVLVLGVVLRDGLALQTQVDSQAQEQAQEQAQRQARTQRTAPATAVNARASTSIAAVTSASQNNDAAVKANAVVRQLEHPWGRMLFTLESETPPGMQWLLLDHNAASPELRFEGVAPNSDMVLDTVNRLSARRGWSEVVLSRLQAPDARASAISSAPEAAAPAVAVARNTATAPASRATKSAPPSPAAVEPPNPLWRFEIRAMVDPRTALTAADRSTDSR